MIIWHELPDGGIRSSTFLSPAFDKRFAFTPSEFRTEEMDFDRLVQGGVGFAPFNWKGVKHLKVEGHVSPYADYTFVDDAGSITDWDSSHYYISTGMFDSYGYWIVPARGEFLAVHTISKTVARAIIGEAYGDTFRYYSWEIAYNKSNKTYYAKKSGGRGLISPMPPLSAESLSQACEACCAYCRAHWATTGSDTAIGPFRYTLIPGGTVKLTKQAVGFLVNHYAWCIEHECYEGQKKINPTLEATAFDAVQKFDGNMLALLPEIKDFGRTTFQSVLDFVDSKHDLRAASSLWLSNRYGDRLTKSDLSELFSSLDQTFLTLPPKRTCRFVRTKSRDKFSITIICEGQPVNVDVQANCQIAVAPKDYNALMKLVRAAYEWDFYPSLGNVWDMIPLSFVVDWFVNVGDIWESVDRLVQARYYDVPAVLLTTKSEAVIPTLRGVKFSYYKRWVEHHLNLGVSSVELGLPSAINVVDGISLLLS